MKGRGKRLSLEPHRPFYSFSDNALPWEEINASLSRAATLTQRKGWSGVPSSYTTVPYETNGPGAANSTSTDCILNRNSSLGTPSSADVPSPQRAVDADEEGRGRRQTTRKVTTRPSQRLYMRETPVSSSTTVERVSAGLTAVV